MTADDSSGDDIGGNGESADTTDERDSIESDAPADGGNSHEVIADDESVIGDATDAELAEEIQGEIIQLVAERDQFVIERDRFVAERDQFKDLAQRLQADFENYRKRVAAQQAAEIDRATGSLAEALLPVLDAAEAAYVTHPDEVGPLFNLLLAELKKQGLESIDLLEQPFDPNLAEAVAHEPGDGGDTVVAEVLRSGYTWNGRTLRPAMVRTRG